MIRRRAQASKSPRNLHRLLKRPRPCLTMVGKQGSRFSRSLFNRRRSIMSYTLYQRLGEADGITRLVDDVMAAHLANPLVKTRFQQIKDMEHAKRMAREFFCAGAGGP